MDNPIRSTKIVLRVWLSLAIALFALGALPMRAAAAVSFVVDKMTDAPDSDLADGICDDGAAGCTLRAAIQQAQHDLSPATITFASGIANSTIMLSNTYGTLYWSGSNITVDGEANNISVSGAGLSTGESVFQIQGNDNQLKHLTVRDAPQDGIQVVDFTSNGNNNLLDRLIIFGNGASGVSIHGSNNNKIQYSVIGVPSDTATTCLDSARNNLNGILIDGAADYTQIEHNLIVCNGNGIYLSGNGYDILGTQITANNIGVAFPESLLPNLFVGIRDQASDGTLVRGNTVSGNVGAGIWMNNSRHAEIYANVIGTAKGYLAPNGSSGMVINNASYDIRVGSPTLAADRNFISGNLGCGIKIADGANSNFMDGNYIGLNEAGVLAVPNGLSGVCLVNDAGNNTLGTENASVTQYVSGNAGQGVYAENSSGITINPATFIGVNVNGSALGNGLAGVYLSNSRNANILAGAIKYNGGAGIAVVGNTSINNHLTPLEISDNGGLPIDLGNDGFTPNGAHSPPGPNNWINYPTVTGSGASGISGTACLNCAVYIYRAIGNPTSNGGGGQFVEKIYAFNGQWSYAFPNGAFNTTLVACLSGYSDQSCSEMSPVVYFNRLFLPLVLAH